MLAWEILFPTPQTQTYLGKTKQSTSPKIGFSMSLGERVSCHTPTTEDRRCLSPVSRWRRPAVHPSSSGARRMRPSMPTTRPPKTVVMTRNTRRYSSYCQSLIISLPLGVSGPMNSKAKPNISARRVHSDPRQAGHGFGRCRESARRRRVYEPTEVGRTAHVTWLRTPIEASTVGRDLGLHLVRFVMMEHAFSRDEVLGFLDNLSTLSRRLPLSLSDTRRSPRLAIATRALPWTTAWQSTGPALNGPVTPSPRSALPLSPLRSHVRSADVEERRNQPEQFA